MSAPSPPIIEDRPDSRNSTLIFYWRAPLSDGDGSGISSYTLHCTSPSTIIQSYPAPQSGGFASITGLTNRTRYFFDLYCTNSNGISSSAVSYFAKQPGNPPIVPFISIALISNVLNVYWSTPTNDGGADIYRYGIWSFAATSNGFPLFNLNALSSKSYTYSNVFFRQIPLPNPASNYCVTVHAINDAGWSSDPFVSSIYRSLVSYTPGIRWNALPTGNYQVDGIYLFNTISSASTGVTFDGTNIGTLTNNFRPVGVFDQYCTEWTGYFYCQTSGTHTFWTESDDWSFVWLGSNAQRGNYTTANALVNNGGSHGVQERSGSISLTSNIYYFIRFSHGDGGGGDDMRLSFQTPTVSRTYNLSNYFFHIPGDPLI